ncbi:uncharacterized protein B4U80_14926 [Leptotrombidium deliense]|uniref:Gamma-retroviral matrix protein domain-containing protein n=1 Tax=Leptotrombidium deliense TaxID=299467 RepID=A0A443S0I8_9ACAR|nr:uncharacterized protein B4U80_14926 [Leptotrombidium deliense]
MGQNQSTQCPTVLTRFLNNFQDFQRRASDYGTTVNGFDLRKFCELEWPSFGVHWPPEGTTDLSVALRFRIINFGRPGHPDQMPYIQIWIDILQDNPKWLKPCHLDYKSSGFEVLPPRHFLPRKIPCPLPIPIQ